MSENIEQQENVVGGFAQSFEVDFLNERVIETQKAIGSMGDFTFRKSWS